MAQWDHIFRSTSQWQWRKYFLCPDARCLTHHLDFCGYNPAVIIFKKLLGCEVATNFKALFLLPWIKMQTTWKHNLLSNSSKRLSDGAALGLVPPQRWARWHWQIALLDSLVALVPSLHYWLWQEFYFCVSLKELPDSVHVSSSMRSALSNSKVTLFSSKVHISFLFLSQI